MKIIVMDCANLRVEILDVADHMVEEDNVELFLAEHGYSLNNISWMAAPIDYVPVQFHEYITDPNNGEEVHTKRSAQLRNSHISVYDSVQEVKHREQEELAAALRHYGDKVDGGWEWHFNEDNCPIVAAYGDVDPYDVVVRAVRVDKDGFIHIIGEDKNCRDYELELMADDFFAGQLDYITSEIEE